MLGRRNLLEAVCGDFVEMAVDDSGDEPFVDALALGLQAQAFGEAARADASGLEALDDGEDAQDLRLAAAHRAGRLRRRQRQVAAAVERADEEGCDGSLVFTLFEGKVDLLEQLLLERHVKRRSCIELMVVFVGEVGRLLAAAVEVVGERPDVHAAVLLVELPPPGWILHLEHGILEVFFFDDRAEVLRGELQDLDGLL